MTALAKVRRRRLWGLACEVAAELNMVADDDERALLFERFEETLAEELRLGAQNRRVVGPLPLRLPRGEW